MKKLSIGSERPGVWPAAQRRARGLELRVGYVDVEMVVRVHVEERPLARRGVGGECRVGRDGEGLRRRPEDAREDLVPDAVRPAVEIAVSDQVLLLRAVDDGAARELRVGDEAAAGVGRARAVVHERREAVDVDAPHRRGLRGRPELSGLAASLARDVDGQVRHRAPEVHERGAAVGEALVVGIDRAVHADVVRRAAESGNLLVVAHLEVERIRGGSVGARHEEQRVALGPELVRELLGGDCVDGRLDRARRHARIEDLHVRAEVGRGGRGGMRRRGGTRDRERPDQESGCEDQAAGG